MSSGNWLFLFFVCAILASFFSVMSRRAEQKEGQRNLNALKKNQRSILDKSALMVSNQDVIMKHLEITGSTPSKKWIRLDFLNASEGTVDCRSSDYIFLLFKASSGIISGEFKIEGSDEIYSFSTRAYANLPLPVKNQEIPEEGRYKSYPNFEYRIKKKTVSESKLSIILFAVSEAGRASPIKLEKPIDIKK